MVCFVVFIVLFGVFILNKGICTLTTLHLGPPPSTAVTRSLFYLKYTTSLHVLLFRKIQSNKKVIEFKSHICMFTKKISPITFLLIRVVSLWTSLRKWPASVWNRDTDLCVTQTRRHGLVKCSIWLSQLTLQQLNPLRNTVILWPTAVTINARHHRHLFLISPAERTPLKEMVKDIGFKIKKDISL